MALVVLGPDKLPRQIGRAVAEFRRITGSVGNEIRRAIDISEPATDAASDARRQVPAPDSTPGSSADDLPPPRD